ncbi:DUF924 family protein [Pseudohoeflea coraliihabitans]|uniref:DUF924 domain-containing protein n=1 Tax=Pseudohoeflea coraliihabitans TaxID=2860393 RepID=A0ABS6WIK9_9HYPH|nr:DUF924 family protein [Pseudohoeflea sp. DP4N28-3]MBW3095784.1 DUF924 domain-containing protein [Pseudohoeflea sp. DP4N28-3]
MAQTPRMVLDYWFETLTPKDWFMKNEAVDQDIRDKFLDLHLALSREVSAEWRADADARLALILVFDQFPRNLFRDSPHAFATDGLALKEARVAVATGLDQSVDANRRAFFYMPFEHSERIEDQKRSVELFEALGNENYLSYAKSHYEVIDTHGRFPHRNAILGRENTPAEEDYLAQPGAGF